MGVGRGVHDHILGLWGNRHLNAPDFVGAPPNHQIRDLRSRNRCRSERKQIQVNGAPWEDA